MTEQEYKSKQSEILKTFEDSLKNLNNEYARSLRKFEIGDIINNGASTIVIESFGYHIWNRLPAPTYIGKKLTKKLQLRKDGKIGTIYGNDKTRLFNINY
jgi:hypothetical protein